MDFFLRLFDSEPFMPHGHCYLYESEVFWLVVISDLLIAIAYFSIPITLAVIVRNRPELRIRWLVLLFVGFIGLCALSHLVMVVGMWEPLYRLEGVLKFSTAIVSMVTAVSLWLLIPKIMQIPTPQDLRKTQTLLTDAEASLRAAEQTNNLQSELFSNISHDLRAPMNGVIGMMELLSEMEDLSPKAKQYVDISRRSGEHLLLIVNDLLDLAKLENGKLTIHPKPFDPWALCRDVIDMGSGQIFQKPVELRCEIAPNVPTSVNGDSTRVAQILINLVFNAIKFTSKGSVTLALSEPNPGLLRFDVIDTGIGIPEDKKQQIFEAFEQADSSIQREFGGTGLGLNISRKLTFLMSGEISLASKIGEGSTFTVVLPLEKID